MKERVTFKSNVESGGGPRRVRHEVNADGGAVADHAFEGDALCPEGVVEHGGVVCLSTVHNHSVQT